MLIGGTFLSAFLALAASAVEAGSFGHGCNSSHSMLVSYEYLHIIDSEKQRRLFCYVQPEDASGQLDYRYDEFGYKVEEEGNWSNLLHHLTSLLVILSYF